MNGSGRPCAPLDSTASMTSALKNKILGLAELRATVQAAREAGKTIVQCHGWFEIVHPGHIRYLEFARRQGDVLIVSVAGDAELPEHERPYLSEELRAENLAALMFVDHVYVNPAPTAESILAVIRPDVYVKGREYESSTDPAFSAEKAVVESNGGRIIYSSGEIVVSSADLLERLPQREQAVSHRIRLVAQRHGVNGRSLAETIDRFRDLHVVVVGDVILDRYVLCDALGVASESPVISVAQREERTYVGGAAIIARHIAALGAHAFLLSSAGRDQGSRTISEVLAGEGVESHLIESRPRVVEKTRFLVEDHKLFKVNSGQVLPLDSISERRAAMILEQQSRLADAVIFCDFGYGTITGGLLARALPTLRQNVRILTADVSGGRANMLHFRHVDLLCPTERELRATLNDYDSGLSAAAWQVLDKTQARHLFVTLEKRGMVVFERRGQDRGTPDWSGRLKSEQLPSFADVCVDRLGCGDALLAASTLALAAGSTLVEAAFLGNAAAAIEIAMLGNHPIPGDRLRDWFRARREMIPEASTPQPPPILREPRPFATVAS